MPLADQRYVRTSGGVSVSDQPLIGSRRYFLRKAWSRCKAAVRPRVNAAEVGKSTVTVDMERSTGALCRVIGLLAQSDQTVQTLLLVDGGSGHRIVLSAGTMTAERADLLADRMRNVIEVSSVTVVLAAQPPISPFLEGAYATGGG